MVIFAPRAYRYNQLTVTEGFTRLLPFDDSTLCILDDSDEKGAHFPDNTRIIQQSISSDAYTNLSVSDCKRHYSQAYIRDRADVIVVVEPQLPENNASQVLGSASGGWGLWPYRWMCPQEISKNFQCQSQLLNTDQWNFPNYKSPKVLYCLSIPKKERCTLEYGFHVAIITVIANFFKVCCFGATYALLRTPNGGEIENTPLLTTGDAIASFLERPDPITKGMSIVEKKDFQKGIWDIRWLAISPMIWRQRQSRPLSCALDKRWWYTDMLM